MGYCIDNESQRVIIAYDNIESINKFDPNYNANIIFSASVLLVDKEGSKDHKIYRSKVKLLEDKMYMNIDDESLELLNTYFNKELNNAFDDKEKYNIRDIKDVELLYKKYEQSTNDTDKDDYSQYYKIYKRINNKLNENNIKDSIKFNTEIKQLLNDNENIKKLIGGDVLDTVMNVSNIKKDTIQKVYKENVLLYYKDNDEKELNILGVLYAIDMSLGSIRLFDESVKNLPINNTYVNQIADYIYTKMVDEYKYDIKKIKENKYEKFIEYLGNVIDNAIFNFESEAEENVLNQLGVDMDFAVKLIVISIIESIDSINNAFIKSFKNIDLLSNESMQIGKLVKNERSENIDAFTSFRNPIINYLFSGIPSKNKGFLGIETYKDKTDVYNEFINKYIKENDFKEYINEYLDESNNINIKKYYDPNSKEGSIYKILLKLDNLNKDDKLDNKLYKNLFNSIIQVDKKSYYKLNNENNGIVIDINNNSNMTVVSNIDKFISSMILKGIIIGDNKKGFRIDRKKLKPLFNLFKKDSFFKNINETKLLEEGKGADYLYSLLDSSSDRYIDDNDYKYGLKLTGNIKEYNAAYLIYKFLDFFNIDVSRDEIFKASTNITPEKFNYIISKIYLPVTVTRGSINIESVNKMLDGEKKEEAKNNMKDLVNTFFNQTDNYVNEEYVEYMEDYNFNKNNIPSKGILQDKRSFLNHLLYYSYYNKDSKKLKDYDKFIKDLRYILRPIVERINRLFAEESNSLVINLDGDNNPLTSLKNKIMDHLPSGMNIFNLVEDNKYKYIGGLSTYFMDLFRSNSYEKNRDERLTDYVIKNNVRTHETVKNINLYNVMVPIYVPMIMINDKKQLRAIKEHGIDLNYIYYAIVNYTHNDVKQKMDREIINGLLSSNNKDNLLSQKFNNNSKKEYIISTKIQKQISDEIIDRIIAPDFYNIFNYYKNYNDNNKYKEMYSNMKYFNYNPIFNLYNHDGTLLIDLIEKFIENEKNINNIENNDLLDRFFNTYKDIKWNMFKRVIYSIADDSINFFNNLPKTYYDKDKKYNLKDETDNNDLKGIKSITGPIFIGLSKSIKELSDSSKNYLDEIIEKNITIFTKNPIIYNYLDERGYKRYSVIKDNTTENNKQYSNIIMISDTNSIKNKDIKNKLKDRKGFNAIINNDLDKNNFDIISIDKERNSNKNLTRNISNDNFSILLGTRISNIKLIQSSVGAGIYNYYKNKDKQVLDDFYNKFKEEFVKIDSRNYNDKSKLIKIYSGKLAKIFKNVSDVLAKRSTSIMVPTGRLGKNDLVINNKTIGYKYSIVIVMQDDIIKYNGKEYEETDGIGYISFSQSLSRAYKLGKNLNYKKLYDNYTKNNYINHKGILNIIKPTIATNVEIEGINSPVFFKGAIQTIIKSGVGDPYKALINVMEKSEQLNNKHVIIVTESSAKLFPYKEAMSIEKLIELSNFENNEFKDKFKEYTDGNSIEIKSDELVEVQTFPTKEKMELVYQNFVNVIIGSLGEKDMDIMYEGKNVTYGELISTIDQYNKDIANIKYERLNKEMFNESDSSNKDQLSDKFIESVINTYKNFNQQELSSYRFNLLNMYFDGRSNKLLQIMLKRNNIVKYKIKGLDAKVIPFSMLKQSEQSNIIYVNKDDAGKDWIDLLEDTKDKNGGIVYKVILPNFIIDKDGKRINLFNDDGTHNKDYIEENIEKDKNGNKDIKSLYLKDSIIEDKAFQSVVIRSPSSGAMSLGAVKIIGIMSDDYLNNVIMSGKYRFNASIDHDGDSVYIPISYYYVDKNEIYLVDEKSNKFEYKQSKILDIMYSILSSNDKQIKKLVDTELSPASLTNLVDRFIKKPTLNNINPFNIKNIADNKVINNINTIGGVFNSMNMIYLTKMLNNIDGHNLRIGIAFHSKLQLGKIKFNNNINVDVNVLDILANAHAMSLDDKTILNKKFDVEQITIYSLMMSFIKSNIKKEDVLNDTMLIFENAAVKEYNANGKKSKFLKYYNDNKKNKKNNKNNKITSKDLAIATLNDSIMEKYGVEKKDIDKYKKYKKISYITTLANDKIAKELLNNMTTVFDTYIKLEKTQSIIYNIYNNIISQKLPSDLFSIIRSIKEYDRFIKEDYNMDSMKYGITITGLKTMFEDYSVPIKRKYYNEITLKLLDKVFPLGSESIQKVFNISSNIDSIVRDDSDSIGITNDKELFNKILNSLLDFSRLNFFIEKNNYENELLIDENDIISNNLTDKQYKENKQRFQKLMIDIFMQLNKNKIIIEDENKKKNKDKNKDNFYNAINVILKNINLLSVSNNMVLSISKSSHFDSMETSLKSAISYLYSVQGIIYKYKSSKGNVEITYKDFIGALVVYGYKILKNNPYNILSFMPNSVLEDYLDIKEGYDNIKEMFSNMDEHPIMYTDFIFGVIENNLDRIENNLDRIENNLDGIEKKIKSYVSDIYINNKDGSITRSYKFRVFPELNIYLRYEYKEYKNNSDLFKIINMEIDKAEGDDTKSKKYKVNNNLYKAFNQYRRYYTGKHITTTKYDVITNLTQKEREKSYDEFYKEIEKIKEINAKNDFKNNADIKSIIEKIVHKFVKIELVRELENNKLHIKEIDKFKKDNGIANTDFEIKNYNSC